MMDDETLRTGGIQMAYHRTEDFSRCVSNCEQLLRAACGAASEDRIVTLTASGTAGMEASVIALFSPGERVLVVNAGDFGQRFADICRIHALEVVEVRLEAGRQLTDSDLKPHEHGGFAGLLMNHHETSTGVLLDLAPAARFCRRHELPFVVDAVGSFLADPVSLAGDGIDALIFSSQKALALPPGLCFVALSRRAQLRAGARPRRSYYFDLNTYLSDLERGQTPFTPAIGLIRQLERRLMSLLEKGVAAHVDSVNALAVDFRERIRGLPLRPFAGSPSNAVTALEPTDGTSPAYYVGRLEQEFGLFVCPNGGQLRDRIFRVGHLGHLSRSDNLLLVAALREIASQPRGTRSGKPPRPTQP
jgi:aspartate aminotransferase-like enzyme